MLLKTKRVQECGSKVEAPNEVCVGESSTPTFILAHDRSGSDKIGNYPKLP
jgi:hypothetical protein